MLRGSFKNIGENLSTLGGRFQMLRGSFKSIGGNLSTLGGRFQMLRGAFFKRKVLRKAVKIVEETRQFFKVV